jgi:hypothetical protein
VQRLRKRISVENEESSKIMKKGERLDRTPSFYTSRSIVNLSGLSVSDPLPKARMSRKNIDDQSNSYFYGNNSSKDCLDNEGKQVEIVVGCDDDW